MTSGRQRPIFPHLVWFTAFGFAVALHAIVLLLIQFPPPSRSIVQPSRPPLEITLIQRPSPAAPSQPEFFSNDNQVAPAPTPPLQPAALAPLRPTAVPTSQAKVVTTDRNESRTATQLPAPIPVVAPPATAPEKKFSVADALAEAATIDREITGQHRTQERTIYINSVNAQKYKAAAYEKAWQDKVERIGNFNYPEAARRKNLSGALILSVSVDKSGAIRDIEIRRPSGHPELDEAAVRIVKLGAPYAKFPPALAEEADILVITRTWKFLTNAFSAEN